VEEHPYLSPEELNHLTPGVLDDAAVEFFVNGHCSSMALAIHLLTRWKLVRFIPSDCDYAHDAIEVGRGCYLDAEGIGAWFRYQAHHGSFVTIRSGWPGRYWSHWRILENIGLVLPWAELVLDRHVPDWRAQP